MSDPHRLPEKPEVSIRLLVERALRAAGVRVLSDSEAEALQKKRGPEASAGGTTSKLDLGSALLESCAS